MIKGPVWNESILRQHSTFPTILAIGDSWFWYVKNNLANPLHKIVNKNQNHVILVRGGNGAEATEYKSGPIRDQIELDLNPKKGYGKTIKAVFISGGGNDLAGPEDFTQILLPDCAGAKKPADCMRSDQPGKLFQTVTASLTSVIELVEKNIPGTPIFVHTYDYANPNGEGFFGLGQWLKHPMNLCKVPKNLHQDVVSYLIDSYFNALIEAQIKFPTLIVVDQRGTLAREDWANELHPTVKGFNKIAKKWEPLLVKKGIA